MFKWPATKGSKGHIESPGDWFFVGPVTLQIIPKKNAFNTFGRSTESCIHYEDELEEEEDDELEASPCLVFFNILSWWKVEETTTNIWFRRVHSLGFSYIVTCLEDGDTPT